jgi:hypothetical protein
MADKNKKLLEKKKAAVMKGNTKRAARIEKKMLNNSLAGMQKARKGRVTKSTGTGTREVDGKEYGVKYKEKVVRRKDGTVKKTVVKEQGLPTGPTGKKSPIKKSRTVKKYRSIKATEPKSKDEASKIQQFKKEDKSVMRKGGTLGYQPTAKYGKVTKASMYMSGGELKMYKKRKK